MAIYFWGTVRMRFIMKSLLAFVLILSTAIGAILHDKLAGTNTNEDEAKAFLELYNEEYGALLNKQQIASWNYEGNLTDANAELFNEASYEASVYFREASAIASTFDQTNFSEDTKRQMAKLNFISLDEAESAELVDILNQMGRIYGEFKACRSNPTTGINECMYLEPEMTELMSQNGNYEDHLWAWKSWHNGVGRQLRPLFLRYKELKNKQAKLNGYEDYGDQWRKRYEMDDLETVVQDLYAKVEPLYKELHAYIRSRLAKVYPGKIDETGPLPVHLLSDMWGRFWINLNDFSLPYPDSPSTDPTPEMISQGYDAKKMFETGIDFYTSMGLYDVPETFFNLSMLEKPTDREVICHPSAWEFYDGKDFRIRLCTKIVFDDFQAVVHELGHIQYYMQYADQPINFREGANDGFQEAIGDLMSASFSTPKHLNTIGLLNVPDDIGVDMNFLLYEALVTVSTLPFHLVQDTWRWKMFRDDIPIEQLNDEYWAEKLEFVGVAPPVARDPELDLDITAIFHVCSDTDMIRYFLRTIYQFQFNEVMCKEAGHVGELFKCDFYGSTAAGDALAAMLKLGSSVPWQDAMETFTGQRDIQVEPLLNYFQPLYEWLKETNRREGNYVGWIPKLADDLKNGNAN